MMAFVAARQRLGAGGPWVPAPGAAFELSEGSWGHPGAGAATDPLEALLVSSGLAAEERGLAATTVLRYENTARRFLGQHAMADGVLKPAGLTGVDINASCCGNAAVCPPGQRRDGSPSFAWSCVSSICGA